MNNILDNSTSFCTGCGVCKFVCPVEAIKYELNENGFFQAFVDETKCINCGKCKKVCAKFDSEYKDSVDINNGKLYSVQSKDVKVINSCTSGGIAYEISKYGIKHSYKIVGVIYDYNLNIAKTVIVDNKKDLEKLKGSKYLQSNSCEAFEKLIEDCKSNNRSKYIVFGTPCQIAGLKKSIKLHKIKNEIITVDLFCHGVPSYLVWQKYLDWLNKEKGIKDIQKINFRSKKISWHDYSIEIHCKNKKYFKCSEGDLFYKSFFDNILLNKACFNCKYRMKYSYADIRLGDFWGKKYILNQDGISAVLILTSVGEKLLKNVNKQINILEECNHNECFKSQSVTEYKNIEINEIALEKLRTNDNLKKCIKYYRKKMNNKWRLRKSLKESTTVLPDKVRSKLRVIVAKMKKI